MTWAINDRAKETSHPDRNSKEQKAKSNALNEKRLERESEAAQFELQALEDELARVEAEQSTPAGQVQAQGGQEVKKARVELKGQKSRARVFSRAVDGPRADDVAVAQLSRLEEDLVATEGERDNLHARLAAVEVQLSEPKPGPDEIKLSSQAQASGRLDTRNERLGAISAKLIAATQSSAALEATYEKLVTDGIKKKQLKSDLAFEDGRARLLAVQAQQGRLAEDHPAVNASAMALEKATNKKLAQVKAKIKTIEHWEDDLEDLHLDIERAGRKRAEVRHNFEGLVGACARLHMENTERAAFLHEIDKQTGGTVFERYRKRDARFDCEKGRSGNLYRKEHGIQAKRSKVELETADLRAETAELQPEAVKLAAAVSAKQTIAADLSREVKVHFDRISARATFQALEALIEHEMWVIRQAEGAPEGADDELCLVQ